MKNRIWFSALILFVSITYRISGQDYNFLSLSVGGALPQGSYAGTTFSDSTNGFAKNGFVFSFDAAWFPDDYMGIGATVTFASNNTDKQPYIDEMKQKLISGFPDPADFPHDSILFDYGVWKNLNLFIGPNFTYPLGRFNLDLRIMGGLSLVWKPTQTVDIDFPETGIFHYENADKAVPALGFSAGGGVRYAFKRGYVLRVMAEYANTRPSFEFIDEITWNPESENYSLSTTDIDVPIKNVHVGIGIAYNFEL